MWPLVRVSRVTTTGQSCDLAVAAQHLQPPAPPSCPRRGNRTTALATAYLEFLFTDAAQDIAARHLFRPIRASGSGRRFPVLELVSVAELGGWPALQKAHFADGGVFDQIFSQR